MNFLQATDIALASILKLFIVTINVIAKDVGQKAQKFIALMLNNNYKTIAARTLFLCIRFVILLIFVLSIVLFQPNNIKSLEPRKIRAYFTKSCLGLIVMYLTYTGYMLLPFPLAVSIGASEAIFAAMISIVRGSEVEYKSLFGAICIALCGIVIRYIDNVLTLGTSSNILTGVMVLFLANFLCACNHQIEKDIAEDGELTVTFYSCMFTMSILLIILCIMAFCGNGINLTVIRSFKPWVQSACLLAAGLSFILLFIGTWIAKQLDTSVNITISNMSIPVQMIYSRIYYKETPNLQAMIGALYIVIGTFFVSYRQTLKNRWTKEIRHINSLRNKIYLTLLSCVMAISFVTFRTIGVYRAQQRIQKMEQLPPKTHKPMIKEILRRSKHVKL